ncbi:hypothetical protein FOA52_003076 [Chlamydomonas sp. UWO 241]|nr:hypothetical protein FOA52_003076 [Chlamydomonas sp. UWO 241]
MQVRVLAEENEALRETVEELSATLAATGASVAAHGMRLDALDAGSSELRSKVATNATNVSTLASRKAAEVNFADFSLLTARVVAGEAVAAGAARAASEAGLQVAALRGAVEMLSEGGGGSTGAGGARTMGAFDALFHTRLASVEGSVKAVRGELRAAVVELGGSCASVAQLDEVAAAVATRARQADIQTLATQQAALATSINGMAEWLAMRPETADGAKGTGGSATKFKCLTCDREIQSQGTPNGRDAAAKGLVLPRLDGMHGTTSMPSGPGTVRLKSPARGAEYEVGAWTTASVPMAVESSLGEMGGSGVGALGSPVRASRAHAHVADVNDTHLRDLMADEARCASLIKEAGGIYADFSRQCVTGKTMELLLSLAEAAGLSAKIEAMFSGQHINAAEDRAVLHVATRARREQVITDGGVNVVPEVWEVLDKIKAFSESVRSGSWSGATGKPLTNVVAIGIGGSFLGPLFVHTALETEPSASSAASGRQLRFLANVDPIDVAAALRGLNPEVTLVVIVSKTFTTAETMLNARTVRKWLQAKLGDGCVSKHMVAVSTNTEFATQFGIDPGSVFGFWDWVGGRFSVCSAVGMLPLALQYGFEQCASFLEGANMMDEHFQGVPLKDNLPVLLGLLCVWNASFLGHATSAILPYCQALAKLAPHIQQVSMESNGKGVDMAGNALTFDAGEVDFGEPGTNGQHSFYQLIHQGRVIPCDFIGGRIIPCDFIGVIDSQQGIALSGEVVSNHDELMCNFFAQADALAVGKTPEALRSEGVPEGLVPHKTFSGNRPSTSLLLPACNAHTLGQLLALYEHRVAVAGFVWGINSFDQWGVELGKVLAGKVRKTVADARKQAREVDASDGLGYSTTRMLNKFLQAGRGPHGDGASGSSDVFPAGLL